MVAHGVPRPQAGVREYARVLSSAVQSRYEEKAGAYARFGNGVLAARAGALLPPGGRLLDLGCASGGLLALLRAQAGHLAGLELSPTAALAAARVGDQVVQGALEDDDLPFAADSFDVVVLGDVLEHLTEPLPALRRALSWCRPQGWVVVSVPNIAHWRARLTLLRGRWPSEESGTFDAGHLRFFTRSTLHELLEQAGLADVREDPVVPALRNHLPVERLPGRVGGPLERAWQAVGRRRPELLAFQLVAAGRRR